MHIRPIILSGFVLATVSSAHAPLYAQDGYGPNPTLPPPSKSLIPTVNIAPAESWKGDAKPVAAQGFAVNAFASGLDHPRWIHVLPNGDVLVAETNAPAKPEDGKGIKGWVMKNVMRKAGAGTKSANRITLLRDTDHDGVADVKSPFLENLNSPFGMALIGSELYVANTDAVMRFPYKMGAQQITEAGVKVTDLPAGPLNHHWTKDLIASENGLRLYATVGSNSNVGENGLDVEEGRAAVWEIDPQTGEKTLFATGLRNPNGLAWQPDSGELWVAVNERDELGDDLVPDYMTSVKRGGFYGWPYSYYGANLDERVKPQNHELVAKALVPDYALGAHTASLGLTFYTGAMFPDRYRGGAIIGQHGSWNRKVPSGYKVVFVPFASGKPSGPPENILTGFISDDGKAQGRPVGVAVDEGGALLVADDVGNVIWRVATTTGKTP